MPNLSRGGYRAQDCLYVGQTLYQERDTSLSFTFLSPFLGYYMDDKVNQLGRKAKHETCMVVRM